MQVFLTVVCMTVLMVACQPASNSHSQASFVLQCPSYHSLVSQPSSPLRFRLSQGGVINVLHAAPLLMAVQLGCFKLAWRDKKLFCHVDIQLGHFRHPSPRWPQAQTQSNLLIMGLYTYNNRDSTPNNGESNGKENGK